MKKSLLVSLAAVMMFGLMGFGFAMWSDTVTVAADVSTGTVAVGIRDVGTNDNILTDDILNGSPTNTEDDVDDAMLLGGDPQVAPGVNNEGKNVASMISENGDFKFSIDGNDFYTSITETIDNAYPYYAPTTQFEIASNGTIPVKLDKIHVEPTTGDLNLESLEYSWVITYSDGTPSESGDGLDGLVSALANEQLHEGEVVTIDLTVKFPQSTPQGVSGDLTLTVHAAQWNEAGQNDPNDDGGNNWF